MPHEPYREDCPECGELLVFRDYGIFRLSGVIICPCCHWCPRIDDAVCELERITADLVEFMRVRQTPKKYKDRRPGSINW